MSSTVEYGAKFPTGSARARVRVCARVRVRARIAIDFKQFLSAAIHHSDVKSSGKKKVDYTLNLVRAMCTRERVTREYR